MCECAYTQDNKDAVTISWKGNPEKRRMEERPNKTKSPAHFKQPVRDDRLTNEYIHSHVHGAAADEHSSGEKRSGIKIPNPPGIGGI